MSNIIITGGTGLIGKKLCEILLSKGHTITVLSRKSVSVNSEKIKYSKWDPEKGIVDKNVISEADYIVHLAGENIGNGRWTSEKRKRIIKSRIDPLRLIEEVIANAEKKPECLISSSASGFYGATTSDGIFVEDDLPGNDFLGNVCQQWEQAADSFENKGIRVVKIRTGIVLSKTEGAFEKMTLSRKFGFLITPGDGNQYLPWIHLDDLCSIYLRAIEDESIRGAINAVAPDHIKYSELNISIRNLMKIKLPIFKIPAFLLKLVLGDASDLILKGSRISSDKITGKKFYFSYPEINKALKDLLF